MSMVMPHGTEISIHVARQVWRWIAARSPDHQRREHDGFLPEAQAPATQPNRSEGSATPPRSMTLLFRMSLHEAAVAVARIKLGLGMIERLSVDPQDGGCTKARISWVEEQTEERLTAVLVATLSGRAAEETIIGSTRATSGGPRSSDLARATAIAFDMEATAGFSRRWPLLHRPTLDRTSLLALDPDIPARVNARLESAYTAARAMVAAEKATIMHLAGLLFEHETLAGLKLDAILGEVRHLMSSPD
jgi:ATP-dependent Zn protease